MASSQPAEPFPSSDEAFPARDEAFSAPSEALPRAPEASARASAACGGPSGESARVGVAGSHRAGGPGRRTVPL